MSHNPYDLGAALGTRVENLVADNLTACEILDELKGCISPPTNIPIVLVEVLPSTAVSSKPIIFISIDRRNAGDFRVFGD